MCDIKYKDIKYKQVFKAPVEYAQYWGYKDDSIETVSIPLSEHPYRTVFACDRDRVMYSTAFRRLQSKTQVFRFGTTDHLRTRLTHTLEVSQIARTIAREVGLDLDLTEAIAYGHDLGHTPFGHVGERTLQAFSEGKDKRLASKEPIDLSDAVIKSLGFKHNLQSVRVLVEYSQQVKITNFLLYGIREHSKRFWNEQNDVSSYEIYNKFCSFTTDKDSQQKPCWSFEAFVVKWADEIAQRHHDIEDAYTQKILTPEEIRKDAKMMIDGLSSNKRIEKKFVNLETEIDNQNRRDSYIDDRFEHKLSSFIVDAYVTAIIHEFSEALLRLKSELNIKYHSDFVRIYPNLVEADIINMMRFEGTQIKDINDRLGEALKHAIIDSYNVQKMDGKGSFIIRKLVRAYIANPQQIPDDYISRLFKIEIYRFINKRKQNSLLKQIQTSMKERYPDNVHSWMIHECREALRLITLSNELTLLVFPALLRVIFDYVSSMTDIEAISQYQQLY
jgi:dGTPase